VQHARPSGIVPGDAIQRDAAGHTT
jgi:hypothetical protein